LFTSKATEYEKSVKSLATKKAEKTIGQKINPCGLFVDTNKPFLAASPGNFSYIISYFIFIANNIYFKLL